MDYKCVGKTGSSAGWARAGARAGRRWPVMEPDLGQGSQDHSRTGPGAVARVATVPRSVIFWILRTQWNHCSRLPHCSHQTLASWALTGSMQCLAVVRVSAYEPDNARPVLVSRTPPPSLTSRAANDPSVFTITEKASTRAFLLKVLTSALTFKTLFRHYFKWELTQSK